jgi:hypothetical protein
MAWWSHSGWTTVQKLARAYSVETTMAKNLKPLEDLNAKAKEAIEQATEQTRGAVDSYFNFLQQTISSYPSGGTDLGDKLKSYAEKNIAATREFVVKLSQAKDFQDVVRIQTEFMQMQMNAFGEQVKSFGEASAKAAATMAKKPSL